MWRPQTSLSSVLGAVCRLSGCLAAALMVRICLSHGWLASTPLALLQMVATLLLSVLIGDAVKEFAFALCETLVTACGRPFFRSSLSVTGKRITEVWLPGGLWVRCETWRTGASLAWTGADGSCTSIQMPSMKLARAPGSSAGSLSG